MDLLLCLPKQLLSERGTVSWKRDGGHNLYPLCYFSLAGLSILLFLSKMSGAKQNFLMKWLVSVPVYVQPSTHNI